MNILIIDNQKKNLDFLRIGLEAEGHFIHTAEDGKEGVLRAVTRTYDLILLNWILPSISGMESCREIRMQHILTPVIFMTSKETLDQTINGLNCGANDYIKKPFSLEDLLSRITVYEKNAQNYEHEYLLSDISVKMNSYKVFKAEREVLLTRKEFLLLAYLVKRKGQICTRSEIIKEIWGVHYEYDTSILDVFMSSIRKKLRITAADKRLRTVRGIGFIADE
ncbi:response regulator transcription factor [Flavobacterium sp. NPDC079362]|uniref:Response regulator ArlR n=1 Tax=Flavobacterium collinsii TaxID=1114861 RepID=A0ABM8KHD0_9FLAO|nr:response regulator transcription factor [Flavobacterium collinsii]CAA9197763.1 Response regulator ArlR [Flavobacterium collinsii]